VAAGLQKIYNRGWSPVRPHPRFDYFGGCGLGFSRDCFNIGETAVHALVIEFKDE